MKVCEFDAHPHRGACIWWAGAEMAGTETGRNRSNEGSNWGSFRAKVVENEVTPATLATSGGPANPDETGADEDGR